MRSIAARRFLRRPFVVAHRAGNRLEALRAAEELSVPLVEADVRLYRGRLEVRHLKTLGPVPLLWDRWALASPWAPRFLLEELLAACGSRTELMLDLKGGGRVGHEVRAAVEPYLGRRAFTVCARRRRVLEAFDGLPVLRLRSLGSARQLRAFLRQGAGGVDGVSVHARLLDEGAMCELRRVVDLVLTWPVNALEDATRLTGLGVDGLISDVPGALLATEVPSR